MKLFAVKLVACKRSASLRIPKSADGVSLNQDHVIRSDGDISRVSQITRVVFYSVI